jgi:hypothetical protein
MPPSLRAQKVTVGRMPEELGLERRLEASMSTSIDRCRLEGHRRSRDDEGRESEVVQLRIDTRLVTDSPIWSFSSVPTAATDCVTSLYRTQPQASPSSRLGAGFESDLEDAIERVGSS